MTLPRFDCLGLWSSKLTISFSPPIDNAIALKHSIVLFDLSSEANEGLFLTSLAAVMKGLDLIKPDSGNLLFRRAL